nr:hypothetical protein [Rhodococcus wratislaviensis]
MGSRTGSRPGTTCAASGLPLAQGKSAKAQSVPRNRRSRSTRARTHRRRHVGYSYHVTARHSELAATTYAQSLTDTITTLNT